MTTWAEVMDRAPLIAILRGLIPAEACDIAQALFDGGFLCVEVPLNSPEPLKSIALMRERFEGRLLIGAGLRARVELAVVQRVRIFVAPGLSAFFNNTDYVAETFADCPPIIDDVNRRLAGGEVP